VEFGLGGGDAGRGRGQAIGPVGVGDQAVALGRDCDREKLEDRRELAGLEGEALDARPPRGDRLDRVALEGGAQGLQGDAEALGGVLASDAQGRASQGPRELLADLVALGEGEEPRGRGLAGVAEQAEHAGDDGLEPLGREPVVAGLSRQLAGFAPGGPEGEEALVEALELLVDAAEAAHGPVAQLEQLRALGDLAGQGLEGVEAGPGIVDRPRRAGELLAEAHARGLVVFVEGLEQVGEGADEAGLLARGRAQLLEGREQVGLAGVVTQALEQQLDRLTAPLEALGEELGLGHVGPGGQAIAERPAQLGPGLGLAGGLNLGLVDAQEHAHAVAGREAKPLARGLDVIFGAGLAGLGGGADLFEGAIGLVEALVGPGALTQQGGAGVELELTGWGLLARCFAARRQAREQGLAGREHELGLVEAAADLEQLLEALAVAGLDRQRALEPAPGLLELARVDRKASQGPGGSEEAAVVLGEALGEGPPVHGRGLAVALAQAQRGELEARLEAIGGEAQQLLEELGAIADPLAQGRVGLTVLARPIPR
jgi:hypothetical protein